MSCGYFDGVLGFGLNARIAAGWLLIEAGGRVTKVEELSMPI
jgi:hypothetical protein